MSIFPSECLVNTILPELRYLFTFHMWPVLVVAGAVGHHGATSRDQLQLRRQHGQRGQNESQELVSVGGTFDAQRSTQTRGEHPGCLQKAAPGSKPKPSVPWGDCSFGDTKSEALIWCQICVYCRCFLQCADLFPIFCVCISTLLMSLFMEACPERAVLSQSA